eukprot:CAMPEP_0178497914 /NCGR_PEP_ID=MMETSP0696-20121128/14957_1 /TAXON_ID=265572 /ORGANISM="Extubocellulus spinifer, Strain CCMP396" /LENGTH=199 /DNA_ID=CAMNT_0020126401 /DNA_START=494 /DNA_END=1094 /DNA_ORIENTATION=+
MVMGSMVPMMSQAFLRGGLKDDNGKPVFSTPYKPWEVPAKYASEGDDLYRAHKAAENIKEWTFHVIPLMWTFFIFGGGIPYIGDSAMEGAVALSTATWLFGCYKYFTGMHYAHMHVSHNFVRFISIFGGGIPYIGDSAMEGAVALSTATWLFGCYKYFTGYQGSANGRQTGFMIRFLVVFFWLSGSAIGLGCAAWNRMK